MPSCALKLSLLHTCNGYVTRVLLILKINENKIVYFSVTEHLQVSFHCILVYQVFPGGCLQCIHQSLSSSKSSCESSYCNQTSLCAVHGGTNHFFFCYPVFIMKYIVASERVMSKVFSHFSNVPVSTKKS